MAYSFDILGISPILHFFNHQQEHKSKNAVGAEYVGTYRCTLDAFLESVEPVPPKRGWNLDEVVDTVINYWMSNSESIQRWNQRLKDAGRENLLVARLADIKSIKAEFESLLD